MPRARKAENKGLPARWRVHHGAYYYQVPVGLEVLWDDKKLYRLGKTLPEAYREWAKRIEASDKANTIGQLLDRYVLTIIPTKAPATQVTNKREVPFLRAVFGDMPLHGIEPQHIYQYIDRRTSRISARREVALLSHAFTKAVEWGYIKKHPFKGEVRLEGETPRSRYVEDWEVAECMKLQPKWKGDAVKVVQAYIRLKLLTGMARGDLLRLEPAKHFLEDGIHNQRHKTKKRTGKRTIYEWTDELRAVVDECMRLRPVDISPYLFCTRRGRGYINEETGKPEGWASIWQRFMKRALAETALKDHFTEHDLRAKASSDAESASHAQALLAHSSINTTNRVYRRKPTKVKPNSPSGVL